MRLFMYDAELVLEILRQIHQTAETILGRFRSVKNPSDFTDTSAGKEKMDSICMLLIVIGESLKKLDKITEGKLLPKYTAVDWKKAKGMRDIITHQYFDVDAEAVFNTCSAKIAPLAATVKKIIEDMVNGDSY